MESTKKTRKKKEKLKAKTISFQRSGFVEDGLIEKIAGLIRDYLEHTSSDEPSESADPGNLRDRIIAKTNSLFTDAVAKQKLYIELCKKVKIFALFLPFSDDSETGVQEAVQRSAERNSRVRNSQVLRMFQIRGFYIR